MPVTRKKRVSSARRSKKGGTHPVTPFTPTTKEQLREAVDMVVDLDYDTPDDSYDAIREKNGIISTWDTSHITDMSSLFARATRFNTNISGWDVSNVTNMTNMFSDAEYFNQDLGKWNVSKVTTMDGMFSGAADFNQDISGWDVSGVDSMRHMFQYAVAFNQDLRAWKVDGRADMTNMFRNSWHMCDTDKVPPRRPPCMTNAEYATCDKSDDGAAVTCGISLADLSREDAVKIPAPGETLATNHTCYNRGSLREWFSQDTALRRKKNPVTGEAVDDAWKRTNLINLKPVCKEVGGVARGGRKGKGTRGGNTGKKKTVGKKRRGTGTRTRKTRTRIRKRRSR